MFAVPCEVFAESGRAIETEHPHDSTVSIELANGHGGYLPTVQHDQVGGYETWPARSRFVAVKAESKIRTETLRVLQVVDER